MSAAKRVAHAAATIRARWERRSTTDPQTEAAQALEDTGQLLDPEAAAELAAFRKAAELAEAVAREGALPVPMGPEPEASAVDADRANAPWGRDEDGRPLLPTGAHWTDIPELVDRTLGIIQARVDKAQSGHWYDAPATESGVAPGTVRTRVDGYMRTVGQFLHLRPGDRALVLHAHDDLVWCLEMIAKARARVTELENALAAAQSTELGALLAELDGEAGAPLAERSADKLTRLLAPTQTLREADDPCHPCGCPKRFDRHAYGCPTLSDSPQAGVE